MPNKLVRLLAVTAAATAAVILPGQATAAPLTAQLTIEATTIETSLVGPVTVSGTATVTITQFRVNPNGQLVAVVSLSGTASSTIPGGRVNVTVSSARVVLQARVDANCSAGTVTIRLNAVAQLDATVTVTRGGKVETFEIAESFRLGGSLSFSATTDEQRALICEIAQLLRASASQKALVDKLSTLLT